MRRASLGIFAALISVFFMIIPVTAMAVTMPAVVRAVQAAPSVNWARAVPDDMTMVMPASWTVHRGQTLSSIAAAAYGSRLLWPALWWTNRRAVPDPDRISAGQVLVLSTWHPDAGWLLADAIRAAGAGLPSRSAGGTVQTASAVHVAYGGGFPSYGTYSFTMLEAVWVWAGGPVWAEWDAATIAECESGGRTWAYNPSGADGLWQIDGVPFPGNPSDGPTNARMAVAKFDAAHGFGPWVCAA